MKRRSFLKGIGGAIAGLGLFGKSGAKAAPKPEMGVDVARKPGRGTVYSINWGGEAVAIHPARAGRNIRRITNIVVSDPTQRAYSPAEIEKIINQLEIKNQ